MNVLTKKLQLQHFYTETARGIKFP